MQQQTSLVIENVHVIVGFSVEDFEKVISPFNTSSKTVLTTYMITLCGNPCTVNKKASSMVIGVCISKIIVIKPEVTGTSAVQLSPLPHRLKNI